MIYLCNVDEESLQNSTQSQYYQDLKLYAEKNNITCLQLCGSIEMEISKINDANDKKDFLEIYNLDEPGLYRLISLAYKHLGLITFFTAGEQEIRAWTIHENSFAPQAAGVIHTDFERGFIKAEVYHINDLAEYKTELSLKDNGKIRQEGKDYLVKDGDVIFFKFNI